MPAIIKNNFRIQGAKDFIKTVFLSQTNPGDTNYYLFVGKPIPWSSSWGLASQTIVSSNADLFPPVPLDTNYSDARVWDEMLGLKRIKPGDVSLVIPRSDWDATGNTVYATFDDSDPNLFNHPTVDDAAKFVTRPGVKAGNFYVLNRLNDLFVCLYNNNDSVSTVQPTKSGTPTNVVATSDGYVWKYITSISSGDAVKFLTDAWIPVKTLLTSDNSSQWTVQEHAKQNPGTLLAAVVTNHSSSTALFENTYTGTVEIVSSTKCKVLSSPAGADDAYTGYELVVGSDKFSISSYDASDAEIGIAGTFTQTSFPTTVTAKIQPKLSVYTNGTSVAVTPYVDPTSKKLSKVFVDAGGLGSSFISVEVSPLPIHSGLILPNIKAILSPLRGLGADPEKDLGAYFVMISTQLKYGEGADPEAPGTQPHLTDFPVKNDYRQIGIIKNIAQNVAQTPLPLCVSDTVRATKKIKVTFSDVGNSLDPGFKSDEMVNITSVGTSGNARVIDFKFFDRAAPSDPIVGQLTIVQTPETKYLSLVPGIVYTVTGQTSTAVAQVTSASDIEFEELKKFEGDILYLENRRPVLRALDQVEDIKTIIEF